MKLYIDREALLKVARANRDTYAGAQPFPHIVLDGLFPEEALDGVLDEFPKPESDVWREFQNYHEERQVTSGEGHIGVFSTLLIYQFNSAPFLTFLEALTGIEGLLPDPHFQSGGLHQIPRGGKLGIHADGNRNHKLRLDRRVNALIYLNRDWKDDYGGHLELWDSAMSRCVKKILPVYNRTVIFNVTDWAYHGYPEPLTCPEGMTRKSIALYYFTNGRPPGETLETHPTLFIKRPGELVPEGTIFTRDSYTGLKGESPRPRQNAERSDKLATAAKHLIRRVTPPILIDAATFLVRRNKDR